MASINKIMSSESKREDFNFETFLSLIPERIKAIILISNTNLNLSANTKKRLKSLPQCIFVYHNMATNFKQLRCYYPRDAGEMLFIRGKGFGYWGLQGNVGEPFYATDPKIPFYGTFALHGKLDLSQRKDITKIDSSWLQAIEEESSYPIDQKPSTGFYTRKIFNNVQKCRPTLEIHTLGFSSDPNYWQQRTISHSGAFEAEDLLNSERSQLHHPLDFIPSMLS